MSFIRLIPTSTGRTIRFVTNRKISFGEAYADSQSQSFNLTAGQIDINDQDKSKSSACCIQPPSCSSTRTASCRLSLNQNAWRLNNIIDWKGTAEN